MRQLCITPVMGKRLIGKGMAQHPHVQAILNGKLVVIAGTTNGYVAEEILSALGQAEGFTRKGFRRGVTVAPGSRLPDLELPGDVVIVDGKWQRGKTIFDVADDLRAGDVVLKGANASRSLRAGSRPDRPSQAGTVHAALAAVYGRRARLIIPVGLEKRVTDDVVELARLINAPEATGPRLYPIYGELFTELDAIALLTGAYAQLIAGGGIYGAEGSAWIAVTGSDEQEEAAVALVHSVRDEPPCEV